MSWGKTGVLNLRFVSTQQGYGGICRTEQANGSFQQGLSNAAFSSFFSHSWDAREIQAQPREDGWEQEAFCKENPQAQKELSTSPSQLIGFPSMSPHLNITSSNMVRAKVVPVRLSKQQVKSLALNFNKKTRNVILAACLHNLLTH